MTSALRKLIVRDINDTSSQCPLRPWFARGHLKGVCVLLRALGSFLRVLFESSLHS